MTTTLIPAPTAAHRALGATPRDNLLSELSPRELEVLALMAGGLSNCAIGEQLTVELKTVETHVGRVFTKLGLNQDRQENRRVLAVLTYFGQSTAAVASTGSTDDRVEIEPIDAAQGIAPGPSRADVPA